MALQGSFIKGGSFVSQGNVGVTDAQEKLLPFKSLNAKSSKLSGVTGGREDSRMNCDMLNCLRRSDETEASAVK